MCEKEKIMITPAEMKLASNVDLQKEKKLCAELHKISCDMYVLQKKMVDLTDRKVFILQQLQTEKNKIFFTKTQLQIFKVTRKHLW